MLLVLAAVAEPEVDELPESLWLETSSVASCGAEVRVGELWRSGL